MKQFTFLALILIGFSACKNETTEVDLGYEYFPMKEGHFVEYDVLEVFHDVKQLPKHDTLRYRLKTVVGEEVVDNSGRLVRKFFQYKYGLKTDELLSHRVWTRLIDGKRGEVVEENKRKIKMVFPLKRGEEWNVNAYNFEKKKIIHYDDVNTEKTINGILFENTARIVYEDFFSLVDYRKMHETYAKGVGLVERSFKDLTIQNFDTLDVQKGNEIHYKLVDFGVE